MTGKKNSKLLTIVTVILSLAVAAIVVGAVLKYTKFGNDIIDVLNPQFRVEYNGVTYTGEGNEIALLKDGLAKFTVKGTNGYSLEIVPNVTTETDFTYTVDGQDYVYSKEKLTSVL